MNPLSRDEHVDFLILGGGVAGLSFALEAAGHGSVLVLTKRQRSEGSTQYAQGGVASVLGPDDDFGLHVEDTLIAGAGLCKREAVEVTVREGPDRIRWLLSLGVELDREGPDRLHLTREGGHSRRRVAHAKDTTGREVERALLDACAAKGIRLIEDEVAVDLVTSGKAGIGGPNRALGAYVLDRASGEIVAISAKVTILATGGAGKVYLYTSNPDVATGDGVAMAYRAGAAVANMEFFQFHPTCLYHPQAKSFLISEALRGEGGILRNAAGEAFMARYDERKELAPRDIVARSIDAEVKRRGDDCAFLDMTHLPKGFLLDHFPHIYATCKEFGIDMAAQPIPVVPAAHYQCGGVVTDLHGATTIPRLFAVGEVSCTGLHGANRLASNSLLEGLVFGRRAELLAMAKTRLQRRPDRYVNKVYGETEVGGTSWLYLTGRPVQEVGLLNLPSTAPPQRTEAIQHGIFRYGMIPIAFYGLLSYIMWRDRLLYNEKGSNAEGSHGGPAPHGTEGGAQ